MTQSNRSAAIGNEPLGVDEAGPNAPGSAIDDNPDLHQDRSRYIYYPTGGSHRMVNVRRMIEQVAGFNTNVLITGESGIGKEWAARYIHALSSRRASPFVPVNCGAIPPGLLESELFGHDTAAFAGAIAARVGRFEAAEGGTLFLDEIGDMGLPMQAKLLHVLQERVFERVGSNRSRSCDVRIIAATHRDLEEAIAAGKFREDLYYRLNVFPIELPALRERIEDLPDLIDKIRHRCGSSGPQPQDFELPSESVPLKAYLENIETALIRRALHQCNGVIAHAARHLQIRRTTLAEKMKRYGITAADAGSDPDF